MRKLALALLSGALAATTSAQSLQPIPELRARVTDLTGTLSAAEQSALEQKLATFEARKGAQIAVLIVATTQPEEIEQYSIRVVEAWALGRTASDDGALLLVAKDDRAVRIEAGYGLEGVLTDAVSSRIGRETIVPRFRAGEFAGGIDAGVDRMMAVVDGEALPPPDPSWARDASELEGLLPFALIAIPFAGGIARRIFGRALGPLVAAGLIFALVWLVTRVLLIALAFALFAALFTAAAGRRPRGRFRRGDHVGWGGGGFGGGGFGGGGFSGGGGGFGGGGATSRW